MTQSFKDAYLGKRFGKLTVIGTKEDRLRPKYVQTRCDCGNKKDILLNNLIYGKSKSCGCERSKRMSEITRKKAKHMILTPKGEISIAQLARDVGMPYHLLLMRFKSGETDIKRLTRPVGKRGYRKAVPDTRLNGMSNKGATEFFKISKQVVSSRLKNGWWVNRHNQWVRANGSILEKKHYGKRRKRRTK